MNTHALARPQHATIDVWIQVRIDPDGLTCIARAYGIYGACGIDQDQQVQLEEQFDEPELLFL